MSNGIIGLGLSLSVNDGSSSAQQAFANVVDVTLPSGEQELTDANYLGMGDANRRYVSTLIAPGDLVFTLQYIKADYTRCVALHGATKTYLVTFPDGSTLSSSGIMLNYPTKGAVADLMTMDVTVRFTGPKTWTPAA